MADQPAARPRRADAALDEAERLLARITREDTDRAVALLSEAAAVKDGDAAVHAALSRAYAL